MKTFLLAASLVLPGTLALAQSDSSGSFTLIRPADSMVTVPQHGGKAAAVPHIFSASVLTLGQTGAAGRSWSNGIELTYMRKLQPRVYAAVPVRVGLARVPVSESGKTIENFVGVDAVGQYGMPLFDARVFPYGTAGLGIVTQDFTRTALQFPVGLGVRVRVGDAASVVAHYEFRGSVGKLPNQQQLGVGILFDLSAARFDPRYWDTDGDGISDADDACVNERGPRRYQGCPDSDRDGIPDDLDGCPDIAGPLLDDGCPDSDGDGVADPYDSCPTERGVAERGGCPVPDADGDGVPDDLDGCPDTFGRLGGCPDSDADGIIDSADACPEVAGPKATRGCPDRDNDGVTDLEDECPLLPGTNNGCPDRDGDGVHDGVDRCPHIAGAAANQGCPEIMRSEEASIIEAVRPLRFAESDSELPTGAEFTLEQLMRTLARHPEYDVRVIGHVDFAEPTDDRMALSAARAEACVAALVEAGVDPARVSSDAVGSGQPIKRGSGGAAYAENRRVEFALFAVER